MYKNLINNYQIIIKIDFLEIKKKKLKFSFLQMISIKKKNYNDKRKCKLIVPKKNNESNKKFFM